MEKTELNGSPPEAAATDTPAPVQDQPSPGTGPSAEQVYLKAVMNEFAQRYISARTDGKGVFYFNQIEEVINAKILHIQVQLIVEHLATTWPTFITDFAAAIAKERDALPVPQIVKAVHGALNPRDRRQ